MQMNDRAAAARYLGVSTCEKTLARNVEGTTRTIHDRNRMASDPVKGFTSASPGNWGSDVDARSSANLFVIERGPRRKDKKREGRRSESGCSSRSKTRWRRGSDGREKLLCISTNLRAGRTRRVTVARREVPTPEQWFMISTKSRSSLFPSLSLTRYNTANQRSRWGYSSSISLSLSLSLPPRFWSLPGTHIDEFIAGTARSIVTKIVYDIDSSFYVNPVSEWFWSTCRGRAFCIRTRTRREEENVTMSCERVRRVVVRVASRGRERRWCYRRIYEETDGAPKLTVCSVALCHRYANWAQLA